MATSHTTTTGRLISNVYLYVDGAELSSDAKADLLRVRVEGSVHLPDMAIVEFRNTDFEWSRQDLIKIGQELKISFGNHDDKGSVPMFIGEAVAMEVDGGLQAELVMRIRAYDRSHRLHRGRFTKAFLNVKDSDIATTVAGSVGLKADVQETQGVHDWVAQNNQTNWEFLQERASIHGFELQVSDKTLVFKPPPSAEREEVPLRWDTELLSFRATQATNEQLKQVPLRDWDPINKKEIVGHAENPNHLPELKEGENHGGNAAKSAFQKEAMMVTAREAVFNQTQADRLAQSILDELAGAFITVQGTAMGNPHLQLGSKVDLQSLGKQFSGKYQVTQITHRFEPERYEIDFEVTGRRSFDLLSLVSGR